MYLLRMRRRDLRVPKTFLWPERVDEVRANSFFQKLKFNWLMVLQLLALALLAFGLARLQTRQEGAAGQITVAVIDSSASMSATDVEPDRFSAAVEHVRKMVSGMKASDQLAIIEAGPTPRVVLSLSNDQTRIRRALDGLKVTHAPSDVGEALRLATALVGTTEGGKIVLLSDGTFPAIEDFTPGKAELVYTQVGESGENVAVQALGVGESASGRQVFVGLKNYGTKPASGTMTLTGDGNLVTSVRFQAEPGESWGRTFETPATHTTYQAVIDTQDVLKADNTRTVAANQSQQVRILLVSPGDPFLERALILDPRVVLNRAAAVPATEKKDAPGPSEYDITIFDGVKPSAVKSEAVVALGGSSAESPVTATGTSKAPVFLTSKPHPLTDGVDFSGVYIDTAEKVRVNTTGTVLAETRDGPLMVINEGAQKYVYLAFEPLDSDFPLHYSFPIFVANLVDYLAETTVSTISEIQTGQVVGLPAGSEDPLPITGPDGFEAMVAPSSGRYIVREFNQVGTYRAGEGDDARTFLVNLTDPVESAVAPADTVSVSGGEVARTSTLVRYTDLWKPMLLVGLCVLAFEWWLYARRS